MLLRLLEPQINDYWQVIRYAVQNSVPPFTYDSPEKMNNIYDALLNGDMQCWVYLDPKDNGESPDLDAVALTTVTQDGVSGVRNLEVYSLYGLAFMQDRAWQEGLQGLMEYAKGQKCHRIIAYSNVPRMIDVAKQLKANTDFTFIYWEVPNGK